MTTGSRDTQRRGFAALKRSYILKLLDIYKMQYLALLLTQ